MKPVEEATQTVGGHPVRIYATDGSGVYPVHGAYWVEERGWLVELWTRNGHHRLNRLNNLDLDLTDWRDEIPWSCLRPEIVAVAREEHGLWFGFARVPDLYTAGWVVALRESGLHLRFSLEGFHIPSAPSDWTQTLAVRSGCEEKKGPHTLSKDDLPPHGWTCTTTLNSCPYLYLSADERRYCTKPGLCPHKARTIPYA